MFDLEKIKDSISCVDFARSHLGLQVNRPGERCVSFRAGATNRTSLLVSERTWWDFGSDHGGDVIDMCAEAMYSGSKGDAIRHLAGLCGMQDHAAPLVDFNVMNNQAAFYHRELQPHHREYLHSRGITDATIDALLIGYAQNDGMWRDRLMFPYWKNGNVVYFIGRACNSTTSSKYMKMKSNIMTEHSVWGMDTRRRGGPIIIAEGIFDALSVYQDGYAVISPITGRFSHEQMRDVISLCHEQEVIVCLDYDPESHTGQRATMAIAHELFLKKIKVKIVMLKGTDKKVDLSELYAAGTTVKSILAGAEDFAHVCIDTVETKEDLEKFLRDVSRFYSTPEVAELCGYVHSLGRFDVRWLRELEKILKKPPTDNEIVQLIKAKHQLIYNEGLGWLEYSPTKGVWAERWENEVKNIISSAWGHYRSGSRINSAYQTMKAESVDRAEFNALGNLLNCRNGMLDVTTGKLLPHSPTYYSTRQLAYDYDPGATCPNFLTFIEQITDEDPDRICLLHEMFGYTLLGDARFQTAFFLLGKGGNGKSKLLEILSYMLGQENISLVSLEGLLDHFQTTALYKSMVNICNETASDIAGAEQRFKDIVSGDSEISACYKYRDHFKFRPTCKFISAGNKHLEIKDPSDGFSRRMRFVDFPLRFVDNPTGSKERLRDYQVTERIKPEMPGILAWSVAGLRSLLEKGSFTETSDQARMMSDFVTLSTPLLEFCEYMISNVPELFLVKHSYTDVYKRYCTWAKEHGTGQYSSRKFWTELQIHMPYVRSKREGHNYCAFDRSQVSDHLRAALAEEPARYSIAKEDII